jgi:hypothetical protein
MKLVIRVILILFLTSPYLITPAAMLVGEYPPVVSQDFIVEAVRPEIIGIPIIEEEVIAKPPVVVQPEVTNVLPMCNGAWRDFKSYMGYKAITAHNSQQYKFISAYMDVNSEDGLLRLKSDTRFIGVALGSYFGKIGSKLKFTLKDGVVFYAVKVEEKSDAHTINGCVTRADSSIIEFVVGRNFYQHYPHAASAGSLHVLPQFKGMVIKIEKLN